MCRNHFMLVHPEYLHIRKISLLRREFLLHYKKDFNGNTNFAWKNWRKLSTKIMPELISCSRTSHRNISIIGVIREVHWITETKKKLWLTYLTVLGVYNFMLCNRVPLIMPTIYNIKISIQVICFQSIV